MRGGSIRRRAVLSALMGGSVATIASRARGANRRARTVTTSRRNDVAGTCVPGHTEGAPACKQLKNDRDVLVWFDATGTPLHTTFGYPCGWTTATSQFDDRDQANVSRSEIGPENAYVDVQVRNYHEPVSEEHLASIAEEGSYDEFEYQYDGETRVGLVSSAESAAYGTVAHATVPDPDTESLVHAEIISTLKGADCPQPQPDYILVQRMLSSLEPNRPVPAVRLEDQRVSGGGHILTVDSVSLPSGGFVGIYETPLPEEIPSANLLGVSRLLTSGRYESVRVTLDTAIGSTQDVAAVVHRDDGNQVFDYQSASNVDEPYQNPSGEAVTDTASVTVPTPATTTTQPTTTERPGTSTSDSAAPTTAPSTPTQTTRGMTTTSPPTDQATEADADGFGFGVSLAALAAATVVWIRRRRDGPGE